MRKAQWLFGLALAFSVTLPACSGRSSLGKKGTDAGQQGGEAGRSTQPATGCTFAPVSVDMSCNDDPNLPLPAGACDPEGTGTCWCRPGFVLNPVSGRCKLDTTVDGGAVICKVGADQTCNDDPGASGIAGTCVGAVACACKTGYLRNPDTLRCKRAPVTDAGSKPAGEVCTFLLDQTCNDDDSFTGLAGVCMKGGTCGCNVGFVLNPSSGRCKADAPRDAGPDLTPDTAGPVTGTCSGSTVACGCRCCTGDRDPAAVCYYPSAGESVSTIEAADQEAAKSPTCASAACSAGQLYLCCVEAPVEPAGSAQYSATFSMSAYDRIALKKTGSDGICMALGLSSPGSTTSKKPLRVSTPTGWGLEALAAGGCSTGSTEQAIGAQGTVTLGSNETRCTISAHVTAFFTSAASGTVTGRRIDADNVPYACH